MWNLEALQRNFKIASKQNGNADDGIVCYC